MSIERVEALVVPNRFPGAPSRCRWAVETPHGAFILDGGWNLREGDLVIVQYDPADQFAQLASPEAS